MSYVGRFLWHELMTTDCEAAKAFYGAVVGYTAEPFGASGTYECFASGGVMHTGLMKLTEEAAAMGAVPAWTAYVGVEDVDASAARVAKMGGNVLAPAFDVPEVGRIAIIADPMGAVIGIYTPSSTPSDPSKESVYDGRVTWNELISPNWKGSLEFYHGLFGWELTSTMEMGEMGTYAMFGFGEDALGGMMKTPEGSPVASMWTYYLSVPNIDAALEAVAANGGTVIAPKMPIPTGDLIAVCADPQGAVFALHGPNV